LDLAGDGALTGERDDGARKDCAVAAVGCAGERIVESHTRCAEIARSLFGGSDGRSGGKALALLHRLVTSEEEDLVAPDGPAQGPTVLVQNILGAARVREEEVLGRHRVVIVIFERH